MTLPNQPQQIHKYFFLDRPPGPGCQPPGHTELEAWIPKRSCEEFKRESFGFATYPDPLPFEAIWAKELFPANCLEKTVYLAWQDCDKDPGQTLDFLKEYWDLSLFELENLVERNDYTAIDVLEAREAGHTWKEVETLLLSEKQEA